MLLLLPGALTASSGAEGGDGGTVAVLFDFGDGTWKWADVTPHGPSNAWCATMAAAEDLGFHLGYSFSPFGVFLESVDGVGTPDDFSKYWGLWEWNENGGRWASSLQGALDLNISKGLAIAWHFGAFGDPAPVADPLTREPWATFRGGRSSQGAAGSYGPHAGGLFWATDVGNGAIDSTLAVANGKVFGVSAGMFDWNTFKFKQLPTVFALDAITGKLLWEFEFQGASGFELGSPAYAGGTVFAALSSGEVVALNASDGSVRWRTVVDDVGLSSSPTVAEGRVLVGTSGGRLVSLWASSGLADWSANLSGGVYMAAPTVSDGAVYIGSENGSLHALHIVNGSEAWSTLLGGRVRGTPLVVEDRIYTISAVYSGISAIDGFLHALNLEGNELWNVSIGPTGSSPAFSEGTILVGSRSGLWAVSTSGSLMWRYQGSGRISASPTVFPGMYYVISNENDTKRDLHTTVLLLSYDGDMVWSRVLEPHNWALSSVSLADHRLYTATDSGLVYCLGDTPYVPDFTYEVDGLKVTFHDDSTALGRDLVHYEWWIEKPDKTLYGPTVSYEFDEPGEYRVSYTVGDEFNEYISTEKTVVVRDTGLLGDVTLLAAIVAIALVAVLSVVVYALRR